MTKTNNGSLLLGIIAIVLFFSSIINLIIKLSWIGNSVLLMIFGIAFSIIGLIYSEKRTYAKTAAIIGLLLNGISIAIIICLVFIGMKT